MSEEPTRLVVSRPQQRAFQRQLERGRAALTPANLLAAVEGLEEGKWRDLGGCLWVPNAKLDEIESHLADRLREVFSYFLQLDPDASWRSVLTALDEIEETKLADRLRQLAEPVTDPTLTVEAVAAALQTVGDWRGVALWLEVPDSIRYSIRDSHSTAEEQKKALAQYFTSTLPAASWSLLAGALYWCKEEAVLQAVSSHLQREDEPTLPNLLSVLEGVTDWYDLGGWLGVPYSKRDDIRLRSPTASEGLEVVLKEWLENHPAPSWRGLARALYWTREVPEHTALQRVYHKYLPAPQTARRVAALQASIKRRGSAALNIAQGVLVGQPRAGKTSLKLRLLGQPAKKHTTSTGVAEKVVRIEVNAAHISGDDWKPVTDLNEEAADLVDGMSAETAADIATPSEVKLAPATGTTSTRDVHRKASPSSSEGSVAAPRERALPVALRESAALPTAHLAARDTLDYFEDAFSSAALQRETKALTDEDRFTLYLTDSGGQPEFQGLLRNMVSGPSLFFIVFRLDQELNATFTIEYQHPDGRVMTPFDATFSTKEALLQILATISSVGSFTKTRAGNEVRLKPKAIFVGTHSDNVSQEKLLGIDGELQVLVKATDSYRDGIVEFASQSQLILPINNLSEDDGDVKAIRAVVERICRRGDDYKVETPYPTLILSIALRFLKDPIISYDYCFERAQQCGIETTDELDDALWFLHHRVGLLRHFSDFSELQNLVILSPQYIFDKVTELVVSTFTFHKAGCSVEEAFRNKGIFPYEAFVKLTSSEGEFILPEQLICLLERLHVIAPLTGHNGKEIKFFAPCVLSHAPSAEVSASSDATLPPLLISFKSGYCPTGLFGVLVVHLLGSAKKTALEWSLEEDRIYRDHITLSVGPHDTFSFRVLPSHMRIQLVWSAKQRKCSIEEVCGDTRRCIENGLDEVIDLLCYSDSAEHRLAFPCPASGHSDAALVKYYKQQPASLVCSKGNKRFDLPPGHEAWFHKEPAPQLQESGEQCSTAKLVTGSNLPELEHGNRKMEFSDLVFGQTIGSGATGTVFKGGWKELDVAIKTVVYNDRVREEIRAVSALKHPNIIKLYGTALKDHHMYIALELADCSLYKHMQQYKEQLNMECSLRWASEIAEGMSYLHEKGIVHRDLKSLNVLLTFSQTAKLCDFDTVRSLDHTTKATLTGTSAWMAPEVIQQEPYSKRCDLFSYGTVFWELMTHKVPFAELTGNYNIQKAIVEGNMPPIPVCVEGYISQLIQSCWDQDPKKRLSFPEVLTVLRTKELQVVNELEHENRKMEFADVTLEEEIGHGAYGTVFRGRWRHWNGPVAIKSVSGRADKEVSLLCDLKHPNIIKLYGTASQTPLFYIVIELAELGSLCSHIGKNRGKPDLALSLAWAVGVARGMSYLHDKDVVHRDLKSANVLLTSEKVAKLCDFGVSRQLDHTTKATMAGSYPWMAPEVIMQKAYSKRCDLFSYGTVLWEMLTHEVPFEGVEGDFKLMSAIVDGNMPPIPKSVEGYLSTLMQSCWDKEPKSRPSFGAVLLVLGSKGSQEAGPGEGAA